MKCSERDTAPVDVGTVNLIGQGFGQRRIDWHPIGKNEVIGNTITNDLSKRGEVITTIPIVTREFSSSE